MVANILNNVSITCLKFAQCHGMMCKFYILLHVHLYVGSTEVVTSGNTAGESTVFPKYIASLSAYFAVH